MITRSDPDPRHFAAAAAELAAATAVRLTVSGECTSVPRTRPLPTKRVGFPPRPPYWPGAVTWLAGGTVTWAGWLIAVMFIVVVTGWPLTVSVSITCRT